MRVYQKEALAAVRHFMVREGGNQVSNHYNGYASSFGATVRFSGLLPALSLFTDTQRSQGQVCRYHFLQAIHFCLEAKKSSIAQAEAKNQEKDGLLKYAVNTCFGPGLYDVELRPDGKVEQLPIVKKASEKELTQQVLSAATAIKLALRNFKAIKDES